MILQKFLEDNEVKNFQDELLQMKQENASKFNIFKVLKLDNHEIRHSNFLAWLLNPSETHGVGDSFLQAFVKTALNETIADTSDIVIETEYCTNKSRRIDILIHSRKSDFVCVIENKYGSDEHDEQCKHYKEFIEKDSLFTGFSKKRYIFLDIYEPDEEELSSALCGYKVITYKDVFSILKDLLSNLYVDETVKQTVKQYTEILKEKYTMLDKNVKSKCAEIYAQYKEVFAVMNEYNTELQSDIYLIMKNLISGSNPVFKNADISGYGYDNKTGCGVRFVPKDYNALDDSESNKITKYSFFYALEYKNELTLSIYNNKWKEYKKVSIDFVGKSNEELMQTIIDMVNELKNDFNKFASC